VSYGVESIRPTNRTRMYALPAFGWPIAGRSNVQLLHGKYVSKINFDGLRATSVTYVDTDNGNTTHTICGKEIILSAGAIASPKLLMLSGVGPADHLQSFDIPVVLDSPDVGSNLRDHNYASIEIEVTDAVYTLSEWQNTTYLADITQQFLTQAIGPLANAPASSFSLIRVPDFAIPAGAAGDFRRSLPSDRGQLQMQYANVALLASPDTGAKKIMTLWVALVQPEATGTIRLASTNWSDFPLIDTAYFGTEGDMAAVLWGYKALRQVLHSPLMAPLIIQEVYPGANVTSDQDLIKAIQGGAQSYHHPMGTCALGTVLDANFRVKDLQGLRVVDASTFPTPPNCHIQAEVYAVAHMAARQILEADRSEGWSR
jgi:choline dehydrogenase